AKALWKGVLELTDYDFRVGNFLIVIGLAGIALVMMLTARRIRGRTILGDAFFPLAILNFGGAQVFLWWWQVNHVLAPILASLLLAVVVLYGNDLQTGLVRWIGIGLIVLVLCGPGGLPYVIVFAVWLLVRIVMKWPALKADGRREELSLLTPVVIALGLLGF